MTVRSPIHFEGTTILSVRRAGRVVMGGDGQVSFGNTVIKGNACKVRRMHGDQNLAGFAGGTADFMLFEMFRGQARWLGMRGLNPGTVRVECCIVPELGEPVRVVSCDLYL
jgi:hypothetical protein